jgi:hypothetical protein
MKMRAQEGSWVGGQKQDYTHATTGADLHLDGMLCRVLQLEHDSTAADGLGRVVGCGVAYRVVRLCWLPGALTLLTLWLTGWGVLVQL